MAASPEGAAQALSRPVRAWDVLGDGSQGVTLGWLISPLWGSRVRIKVMVKRILNKHGCPPDLQEEAVKTVLMQAELLCAEWV
jgi:type I restriction enzyme R subunit